MMRIGYGRSDFRGQISDVGDFGLRPQHSVDMGRGWGCGVGLG